MEVLVHGSEGHSDSNLLIHFAYIMLSPCQNDGAAILHCKKIDHGTPCPWCLHPLVFCSLPTHDFPAPPIKLWLVYVWHTLDHAKIVPVNDCSNQGMTLFHRLYFWQTLHRALTIRSTGSYTMASTNWNQQKGPHSQVPEVHSFLSLWYNDSRLFLILHAVSCKFQALFYLLHLWYAISQSDVQSFPLVFFKEASKWCRNTARSVHVEVGT